MPETLLTPFEAACLLAVSKTRLYRLTGAGVVPTVRLGRSLRFSPAALEAFVESGGVGRLHAEKFALQSEPRAIVPVEEAS